MSHDADGRLAPDKRGWLRPAPWLDPELAWHLQRPALQVLLLWMGIGLVVFFASMYFYTGSRSEHRALYYLLVFLPFLLFFLWRPSLWQMLAGSMAMRLTLVLCVVAVASSFYAPTPFEVSALYDNLRYAILVLSFLALLFCLQSACPGYLRLLWVAVLLAAVASSIWHSAGYFMDLGGLHIGPRMDPGLSYISNPGPLSHFFVVGALIAFAFALRASKARNTVVLLAAGFVCLVPVLLSQSRGPLLAFGVALLILLLVERRWMMTLVALIFGGLATLVIASGMVDYRDMADMKNIETRLAIYKVTLERVAEHPWLGHGWAESNRVEVPGARDYAHPHNTYLTVWFHGGLVSLGLFLALLFFACREFFLTANRSSEVLAAFAVLVSFMVGSLVSTRAVFTNPDQGWLLFWVPVAVLGVLELVRKKRKEIGMHSQGGAAE